MAIAATARRGTFAAFSYKGYGALWLNSLFVSLSLVMTITTQFIVIADLTGSNGAVGGVTFALGVPMLLFGPVAGVLADRVSKQLILLFVQAAMGASALSLGCLLLTDLISVPWVLLAAGITGMAVSLLGPAQMAYMGQLVPREDVGNATALLQVSLSVTRVAGPLFVAGLVAIDAIGPTGAFFAIAGILLAALAPLIALPRVQAGAAVVESILGEVVLGVRHVVHQPRLFRIVVTFLGVTLLGFSYFVVLPRFADDVLGAGDSGYGIIVGVSSAGGLVANLLLAPLADSRRVTLLLNLSVVAFGAGLLATGAAPSFGMALLTMIVVGAAASAFQVLSNAAALRASDIIYFGRVTAILNIAWSLTNLVGLPVGFVADAAGERATLAGVGAGLLGMAALLGLWSAVPVPRAQAAEAEA